MPGVSISESFSDNGNLATRDGERKAELSTVVSPRISVNGQGGRVSLNLNYTLDQVFNHLHGNDRTDHSLAARGQVELWKRVAFIDTQASISRQVIDATQPASVSIAGRDQNRTNTYAFNISPYFLHSFGSWADTETRIRYNQVNTETGRVSDTTELAESLTINSGRRFTRVPWSVVAHNSKLARSGDDGARRVRTVTGHGTYAVNRQFSLIGSLGWENIRDPLRIENPSGLTWRGGFALQPGRRSSMRLTYGHQEGNDSFEFEGNYQISTRTAVTAAYNESVQTSQSRISQDIGFLGTDPVTGALIDVRTGRPFFPGDEQFDLTDDSFLQKRFTLNLTGSRKRNTFSGQLRWESRDFERLARRTEVVGGDLRITRTLSHRATASAGVSVEHWESTEGVDNAYMQYTVNAVYNYRIREDTRFTLGYMLRLRDSDDSRRDFYENVVTAGLSRTF